MQFLVYLKHLLGFHSKDCPIKCAPRQYLQDYYTCRITLLDFKKEKIDETKAK